MAQELKPIETLYAGEKFRSKLEAQWAVFFDACGIEWEYEPEGYDLGDGVWYLPDFRLKYDNGIFDVTVYIEVKGRMRDNDEEKISRFSEAVDQLSMDGNITDFIVVGNIPKGETIDEVARFIHDHEPPYYGIRYSVNGTKTGSRYPGIYHCTDYSVQWEYERPPVWAKDYNVSGKKQFYIGYASELIHANASATVEAFAAARYFRFDHGGWKSRQAQIAYLDTDDSWRRRWYKARQSTLKARITQRRAALNKDGYKGTRFDTELELQWAMVFDFLHIEWEYHPKLERVFDDENSPDGKWHIQYTPTFWLPKIGMYAEVEPDSDSFGRDSETLAWMVDWYGPCADGIIILSQLPLGELAYAYIPMFPVLYHTGKSIGCTFGTFLETLDNDRSWYPGFLYDNDLDDEKIYRAIDGPVDFEDRTGDAPMLPENVTLKTEYVYQDPSYQVFSRAIEYAARFGTDVKEP